MTTTFHNQWTLPLHLFVFFAICEYICFLEVICICSGKCNEMPNDNSQKTTTSYQQLSMIIDAQLTSDEN